MYLYILLYYSSYYFRNMSMQVACVAPSRQYVLPPSDVDRMKAELEKIDKFMKEINAGNATEETFKNLKYAIEVANEIILSLDNSNGNFKIHFYTTKSFRFLICVF